MPRARKGTSSATPTRANPGPSRTACCSIPSPPAFSKAWRSRPYRSARPRASSICAASTGTCRSSFSATSTPCAPAGGLGTSIRGAPGFDFDIEIHMGAGGYVCGEGTAQIESLEGKPGRPRVRPPSMVLVGYLGKPTVVDNVETLAHCTEIAIEGGASFAKRGNEDLDRHEADLGLRRLRTARHLRIPVRRDDPAHSRGLRRERRNRRADRRRLGRPGHARRVQPPHRLRGRLDGRRLHDVRPATGTCSRSPAISRISSPTRAAASARPAASAPRSSATSWTRSPKAAARSYEVNDLKRLGEFMKTHQPLRPRRDRRQRGARRAQQVPPRVRETAGSARFRAGGRSRSGARACAARRPAATTPTRISRRRADANGQRIHHRRAAGSLRSRPDHPRSGEGRRHLHSAPLLPARFQAARRLQALHGPRQRPHADGLHPQGRRRAGSRRQHARTRRDAALAGADAVHRRQPFLPRLREERRLPVAGAGLRIRDDVAAFRRALPRTGGSTRRIPTC